LDAPARAVIGVPGKARGRNGLMPAGMSKAAWRRRAHSVVTQAMKRIGAKNGCIL